MSFTRILGAPADLKELEYIAALHQTCLPDTRDNGTVSSLDVQRFLSSRYGLRLTHAETIEIVRGLGGGISQDEIHQTKRASTNYASMLSQILRRSTRKKDPNEEDPMSTSSSGHAKTKICEADYGNDVTYPENELREESDPIDDLDLPEEYLDIVQVVSILFIPTIARAGREFRDGEDGDTKPPMEALEESKLPRDIDSNWYDRQKQLRDNKRNKSRVEEEKQVMLRPQSPRLIQDVLGFLLQGSAAGTENWPPRLDEDLMKSILLESGEHERAENKQLVRDMVEAARSASGLLDEEAFVNALTSDLGDWKVGSEDRLSTLYADVYEDDERVEGDEEGAIKPTGDDKAENSGNFEGKNALDHANIDFVVDAHSSVTVVMLIWLFFVCSTTVYASLFQALVSAPCMDNGQGDKFRCQLSSVFWTWLVIAFFLSCFGVLIIVPLSLGNNPHVRSPRRLIIAIAFTLLYTILPYLAVYRFEETASKPYNDAEDRVQKTFWQPFKNMTMGVGFFLALIFTWRLLIILLVDWGKDFGGRLKSFTISSNLQGEYRLKQAATRKLNTMMVNAHTLHQVDTAPDKSVRASMGDSSFAARAMLNFVLRGQREEKIGGIVWTFGQIFSGKLFDTEGIWLPTRLIVFQGAQVIIAAFLGFAFIYLTITAAEMAEDAQGTLNDYDMPQWAIDIVPTRQNVQVALYTSSGAAILGMFNLILIYIPSSVATILQYRCGQIPSLGSRYFTKYRDAVETAYMNTGNAIYGMFGMALLIYGIVGLVIFLYIWEFTRPIVLRLTAWGLGLGLTIMCKMLLTKTCRNATHKSFYRTRPRQANITALALECWFIGLGGSVLIGRITQFLCAAVFWVGRIDVPFLSEDVSVFGYAFDYVPTNFTKELLVHEAHRHPYLERLAQMYLMKLKHNTSFCSDAGAVWRQLFVQAIMPWARKYRVFNEERISETMKALSKRRMETEEDNKGTLARMGEDLGDLKDNAGNLGTAAVTGIGDLGTTTALGLGDLGTAVTSGSKDLGTEVVSNLSPVLGAHQSSF